MSKLYREEYRFEEIGRSASIKGFSGIGDVFEFIVEFEFKQGVYGKIGRNLTINGARGNLGGFLTALCMIKGDPSSSEYDVKYQAVLKTILPALLGNKDWLETRCVSPMPRPSEQNLMKSLANY